LQKLRSFIALLLVAVLSLAVAPKELLHAFHEHEDTHHGSASEGPAFEEAHVHCVLLNVETPVYVSEAPPAAQEASVIDFIYSENFIPAFASRELFHPSLRGPPAC